MPVKRNWLWKSGTFPFTHICFCCFFSPKLEFYKNGKDQKRCLESLSLEIWLSFSIDCQFCNFKLVVFGGFLMAAQSLQYHLWILLSWFLLWDCWKLENHLCQILSFFSAKLFTFYDFDMRQTQFMQPGPREEEENSYGNNPIFFSSLVFLFFFGLTWSEWMRVIVLFKVLEIRIIILRIDNVAPFSTIIILFFKGMEIRIIIVEKGVTLPILQ